jgi:hypothetical protein
MLPILAIGALYLRFKRLPKEARPNFISTVLLWVASITMIVAVSYSLGRELIGVLTK